MFAVVLTVFQDQQPHILIIGEARHCKEQLLRLLQKFDVLFSRKLQGAIRSI